MKTYTYIKRDQRGFFIEFNEKFSEELYNNLGSTYEDFMDNKWVLLSDEQVKFRKENPNASVKEVWDMELTPVHVRDINDAKREMIGKIYSYDSSDSVNGFTINNAATAWINSQERLSYKHSIDSAKILGVDKLSFYIAGQVMEISTEQAEQMLAALQLYADACFMVTKQHLAQVEALSEMEEVDNYDYESGYPERLNFNF